MYFNCYLLGCWCPQACFWSNTQLSLVSSVIASPMCFFGWLLNRSESAWELHNQRAVRTLTLYPTCLIDSKTYHKSANSLPCALGCCWKPEVSRSGVPSLQPSPSCSSKLQNYGVQGEGVARGWACRVVVVVVKRSFTYRLDAATGQTSGHWLGLGGN